MRVTIMAFVVVVERRVGCFVVLFPASAGVVVGKVTAV
jgi:hypothetical protein